jgi:tryptophan synthase alpha chain
VDLLKQIRAYNAHIPIGLLLYYNLLHRQGVSQVHARLNDAGIDAILAVDLPLEESASHEASLKQHGLGNISLIAPNTDETRAKLLLEHTTAFAYVVSSFGTTGVRTTLPEALPKRLQALKALGKSVPLVVGFGIAEAKQVNELRGAGADAVIIGSAITRLIEDNLASPKQAVTALQQFLTQLKG